ncbi:MAG: acVLRF1 family peptidyl-tRNA hydrolase [Nocardioides sp.]
MRTLLIPVARWERWVHNFVARHGETSFAVVDSAWRGVGADDATFVARLPFDRSYATSPAVLARAPSEGEVGAEPELADLDPGLGEHFIAAAAPPPDWGVLLVRKGGFAVARLSGSQMSASKTGQRHVQGRTKAGGQSQQRFARRRDNQARVAYEAAAEHAARLLVGAALPVVCGGDRAAVTAVLADARLAHLTPLARWLPVPDPRRQVLEQAVADALALEVSITP